MQMKKNLIKIKECPICKKKKFINYGRIINIHKDLKKFGKKEDINQDLIGNNRHFQWHLQAVFVLD